MKHGALRSLDPRPKLLMMATTSTICLLTESISLLLTILCIITATVLIGGATPRRLWNNSKPLLLLIASIFIIQSLFSGKGTAGVILAAVLSLRLIILVLSAQILLEGEIRDYTLAFTQMHIPYEISFMVTTGLHFLPILREEALNIYHCVQLRGTSFKKTSLPQKLKAYTSICLPILVSTLRKAEEMSIAMETRGLRARPKRTAMRRLTLKSKDIITMILWPAAIITLYLIWHWIPFQF
jgi:energy-coupling factor transport system permease protein